MAQRRTGEHPIGATVAPDFDSEQAQTIELRKLDAGFVLEDSIITVGSLSEVNAGSGSIARAHLKDVDLSHAKLRAVRLTDVVGERIDAANGDWGGAQLRRVQLIGARLTGLNLAEAHIEQVSFKGCKLDYANFRHATIKHVSFEDCVLTGADFQGASLDATLFSVCQLGEADFSKAKLSRVDLRSSELSLAGSVLGLGGAIIDPLQLMELARTLAQELGIVVEDQMCSSPE